MNIIFKNQNGFTLVELLIALVIFSVGILGVATMQITSIKGNGKANQISEASNAGADRIEILIALGYADALLNDGDADGVGGLGHATTATADYFRDRDGDGTDDIFWNIAVDQPISNTKTIRVIVVPAGSGRNVEMTYVKANVI